MTRLQPEMHSDFMMNWGHRHLWPLLAHLAFLSSGIAYSQPSTLPRIEVRPKIDQVETPCFTNFTAPQSTELWGLEDAISFVKNEGYGTDLQFGYTDNEGAQYVVSGRSNNIQLEGCNLDYGTLTVTLFEDIGDVRIEYQVSHLATSLDYPFGIPDGPSMVRKLRSAAQYYFEKSLWYNHADTHIDWKWNPDWQWSDEYDGQEFDAGSAKGKDEAVLNNVNTWSCDCNAEFWPPFIMDYHPIGVIQEGNACRGGGVFNLWTCKNMAEMSLREEQGVYYIDLNQSMHLYCPKFRLIDKLCGSSEKDWGFTQLDYLNEDLLVSSPRVNGYRRLNELNDEEPALAPWYPFLIMNDISTYDIEQMVRFFLTDADNLGLKSSNPDLQNITTRFAEIGDGVLGLAYGMGVDSEIVLQIDPLEWKEASDPTRWYLVYHEMGHDYFNLEHGEGGKMMFPFADRSYTWFEFARDRKAMMEDMKRRIESGHSF